MDFAEVGQELAEGLAADPDAGVAWRHGWERGRPRRCPPRMTFLGNGGRRALLAAPSDRAHHSGAFQIRSIKHGTGADGTRSGTKTVLTGVARSKGRSPGQTLVSEGRMGWGYNHVGDEDGIVLLPNSNIQVRMRERQDRCYPTVLLDAALGRALLQSPGVTRGTGRHHLSAGPLHRHRRCHRRRDPRGRQPRPAGR